jgi:hypothetical protein
VERERRREEKEKDIVKREGDKSERCERGG